VGQLGLAAFAAERIVCALEPVMAATGAGPALTRFFCWKHYSVLHNSHLVIKNILFSLLQLLCQVKFTPLKISGGAFNPPMAGKPSPR